MEDYQCEICNKSFYKKRYLSDHLKRTHNKGKEKESNMEIKCDVCGKTFANKKTESSHRITTHGHLSQKLKKTMLCQEENCNESFSLLSDLRNHLKETHNYDGLDRCEEIEFDCFEDFMQWFATEERNSGSHFILNRGSKSFSPNSKSYYACSRSGVFKLSSEGKRQLKAQGTKKIGFHCTAQIIVVMKEKAVSVKYYGQHYKHDNDVQHAPMPDEVKKTIASKLVQGINDKRILEDVRSSTNKKIITQKDIHNIKALIGQSKNLPDDVGLKIWIESFKEKGHLILHFKEQNTEHSVLETEDFFLAFIFKQQMCMFQKFGNDRICIDSTHGITGYSFELVTIMVVDEFEEGFPVAFCLTSKVNFNVVRYFFETIKSCISIKGETKVFMSDDASFFYEAWKDVFGPTERYLLCSWHVDRAWQGHLNTIPLEKRGLVYKALKSIMYELDNSTFENLLSQFLKELQDDKDLNTFYNYFKKYYSNRCNVWAYCFRKGAKINTNMHLEHFHRELKHIYLEGKKCKRVDKCCKNLEKYITDKAYDRYIKIHKGKITKKHTLAFQQHQMSKNILQNCLQVSQNKWSVKSESIPSKEYTVTKEHDCDLNKCNIICRECTCCMLAFQCTCHNYQIQNILCKHIHAININLKPVDEKTTYSGKLFDAPKENSPPLDVFQFSNSSQSINKETVVDKIYELYLKAKEKSTIDEVVGKKIIDSVNMINTLLDIPINQDNLPVAVSKEPCNKKIAPQKRFFSTKKTKAKKRKLSKPSTHESENIKRALLNLPIISRNPLNDHEYT